MFAFLADMSHFYAVLSTLPAGAGCTTAELSVTFLGQPPSARCEFTASSEVVYADDRNALGVAFVRDGHGQAVAHSTSRYFLFPAGSVKRRRFSPASPVAARSPLPAPILRPYEPAFSPLEEQTLDRLDGLEILQAELTGKWGPVSGTVGGELDLDCFNVKGSLKAGSAIGVGVGVDTNGDWSGTYGGSGKEDFNGRGVRNENGSFGFKTEGKLVLKGCGQF